MLFVPEGSTNHGQSAVASSLAFQASSHHGCSHFPFSFILGYQSAYSVLVRVFQTEGPFLSREYSKLACHCRHESLQSLNIFKLWPTALVV